MLFQRLYNWIKYKTLPSSFLFKNRLFIERDSKHRRILSNFGLSFRNSKWSNYETYNIKTNFKNSYFKFLISIFFLITFFFFILYYKNYYIFFYFFNNVSFCFWISIDTFDYYLSFLVWLFSILISSFFNFIYSYFFFNNFSNPLNNKNVFSSQVYLNKVPTQNLNNKNNSLSKHDLNVLLYSWLTNFKSTNNTLVLEQIFETNFNKKWWNEYYDFFIKLYKVTFFLNTSSEKNNIFYLNSLVNSFNTFFKGNHNQLVNYFNNNPLIQSHTSLIFHYFLKNYINYFNKKNLKSNSLSFLNTRYDWNLYNFNNELEKYSFLLKNKIGLFFFSNLNYQKFSYLIFNFNELWTLNSYFKNQLTSAKWNRWLYRYSILHRKVLKNSHKITLSKKLINSGFYDSKIFNKNIWAVEHFSKLNNIDSFSSLFNSYYKNLFNVNNNFFLNNNLILNNNGSQKNSLNLINFYENSYFWYLKRFYLFNNLSTNSIKSKVLIKNLSLNNEEKSNNSLIFKKYSILLQYLLNSSSINLKIFSHNSNNFLNTENFFVNEFYDKNKNFNLFYNLKDLYLINNEKEIFNKDNLNFLYWITSTSGFNNNLFFFNYFKYNYFFKKINIKFYNNNYQNFNFLNSYLAYSLINYDKIYLNDLIYLSLFY